MWNEPALLLLTILSSLECACGWSIAIQPSCSSEIAPKTRIPRPLQLATRSFELGDDDEAGGDSASDTAWDPDEDLLSDDLISDAELEATSGDWDDRIARFNTIHLTGRIGNDPEPRYFDDGKVVVNLSLATTRKYHSLERQAENIAWGQEETDWYSLEIWGKIAEYVSKFVDKGTHVSIIGSLQIDEWTDRETGELRNKAKVVVRDFDVLESKEEADARRSRQGKSSYDQKDGGPPRPAGYGGFF
jgi:single-strand DNA-binding protein